MKILNLQKGQAMIVLVAIVAIATFIISEIFILSTSSLILSVESSENYLLSSKSEGYVENAAIRFLRDPSYTGESLNDGDISCTIDVTDLGGGITDLSSSCQRKGRVQTVGMTANNGGGSFTFSKIQKR